MAHVFRLIVVFVLLLPLPAFAQKTDGIWYNPNSSDGCKATRNCSLYQALAPMRVESGGYLPGVFVSAEFVRSIPGHGVDEFNVTFTREVKADGRIITFTVIYHRILFTCPDGALLTSDLTCPPQCNSGDILYSFSGFYVDDHESVCIDGCEADLQRYIDIPPGGGDGILKGKYVATGETCTAIEDDLPEDTDTSCTPPATANPPVCPNNGSPYYNCESGWQCMTKPWDCSGYNANDGTHEYHWNGHTCQQMAPCGTGTVRNSIGVCVQSGNPDPGNPDPSNPGGDPGDPSDPTNPGDPGTNPGGIIGGGGGGNGSGGDGSEHCKPGFVWSGTGCVTPGSGGGGNGTKPGDTTTDEDGSGGRWSGTCGTAPVCEGDPVLCAIAKMEHERYCETEWMRKDNDLSRLGQESYDSLNSISDADANAALNKDGELDIDFSDMWEDNQKEWVRPPVSGQCIDIPPFEVMGATIKMDAGPLCAVADFVRVILHILAYMAVMRAVVKG